jgi:hypothetical protein
MAYFNNTNNTNFYSTSFAFGEPDAYPFLSQMSATEDADDSQTYGSLADRWGMVERPGPMVGPPTSSWAAASYGSYHCSLFIDRCLTRESLGSTSWYAAQTNGYEQPSHSGNHWPAAGQQDQSYRPSLVSWDESFTSTTAPEPSATVPAPSSGKSLFCFEALGDVVLTNRDQSRSTTGGSTRAGPPPTRSM